MIQLPTLAETLCWRIPACPMSLIFLLPLVAVGMSFSLGLRNPFALTGLAFFVMGAMLLLANPNPFLLVVMVLSAFGTAAGYLRLRR